MIAVEMWEWKHENGNMETEKIGRKFDDGIHLEYETCEKNSDDRINLD